MWKIENFEKSSSNLQGAEVAGKHLDQYTTQVFLVHERRLIVVLQY